MSYHDNDNVSFESCIERKGLFPTRFERQKNDLVTIYCTEISIRIRRRPAIFSESHSNSGRDVITLHLTFDRYP